MKGNKYIIGVLLFFCSNLCYAQNKYEEVIPYEEIDGMVVFPVKTNGKDHKFVFNPIGLPAILDEYADEVGFVRSSGKIDFSWGDCEVVSGGGMQKLTIGQTIFIEKIGALAIRSEYFRKNGISGMVNATPFVGYVVTIDAKNKLMTISTPYKPTYISQRNRVELTQMLGATKLFIGGKEIEVFLDLASNKQEVRLSPKDAAKLGLSDAPNKSRKLPLVVLAKNEIENMDAYVSAEDTVSTLGGGILAHGILSLDYIKSRLYFQKHEDIDQEAIMAAMQVLKPKMVDISDNEVVVLDRMNFGNYVFDYKTETEWNYKGDLPAIIDFWAEWCGPCVRISKSLEELAKEYAGKIRIFKVNFDEELEIAKYFKVQSLPTLLYIPLDGDPVQYVGASSKENLIERIEKVLLKK